jgi:hypothetical protein
MAENMNDTSLTEMEYIPETCVDMSVWLMLGSAYVLGGNYQRVIQPLENEELGDIALNIAKIETITVPMMLEKLGLPQPLEASFWVTGVLPAVRRELELRVSPARSRGYKTSISRIKANNRIEDVAGRLTSLQKSGQGMKGLCPFHKERSPSFYVWPASQRWRCFGSCVEGGDVIDLLRRHREQGGLT